MPGQRQPIELLLIKGKKHLTKAEIEERRSREIRAPSDKVKAPSYLDKAAKKEFNRIAKELLDIGIMTNLDVDALARFVIARRMYLDVTRELLQMSPHHPEYLDLLQAQDKLFKQCRQSAGDLGLTISSRCRLVVPKKEEPKPKTEEEKLFGGRL